MSVTTCVAPALMIVLHNNTSMPSLAHGSGPIHPDHHHVPCAACLAAGSNNNENGQKEGLLLLTEGKVCVREGGREESVATTTHPGSFPLRGLAQAPRHAARKRRLSYLSEAEAASRWRSCTSSPGTGSAAGTTPRSSRTGCSSARGRGAGRPGGGPSHDAPPKRPRRLSGQRRRGRRRRRHPQQALLFLLLPLPQDQEATTSVTGEKVEWHKEWNSGGLPASPPCPVGLPPPPSGLPGPSLRTDATNLLISEAEEDCAMEDVLSPLNEALDNCRKTLRKQVCDDIGKRLVILQQMWEQGKLSAPVRKGMRILIHEFKNQHWDAADEIHRSLMVDHVTEVNQWMVGVKRLIAESRNLPTEDLATVEHEQKVQTSLEPECQHD